MSEEGSLRQAAAANDVDQDILAGVVELPMHRPVVGSPNDTGADAGEKSNAVVVVPEEDILRSVKMVSTQTTICKNLDYVLGGPFSDANDFYVDLYSVLQMTQTLVPLSNWI